MKRLFLYFLAILLWQKTKAQVNSIPVYYTPVAMPEFLKDNYYGLFDTRLLAMDLAGLLQKATGRHYVATPNHHGNEKGIFLLLDSISDSAGNEAGLFESDGKSYIRITARYTTGISYAMYSWLEELGFRFYLPGDDWATIPAVNPLFNNKPVKKIYKPGFKLRMFSASGGILPVKGLDENGNNGYAWRQWYQRNRMGCDYIRIDGHMGEAFNLANRKEIEQDSLIIAPRNGKRAFNVSSKLDPTYKKGVDLFSNWIVTSFKKEKASFPSFLPFKKYFSVDAGDGYDYCHTPECEKAFATVSDQVFSIANKTAIKIKQIDSNAGVSSLAYAERAAPPGIALEPNVHVMVVPTAFQSVGTAAYLMQQWAKKTSNLSMYDYINIGVWAYDKPFYNLHEYFQNLEYLKLLNIQGISFETSLSKFSSGVQQYLILKYLCDPYTSIDSALDEFCNNNFQAAAAPIKKLLQEWYFSSVHLRTNYDYASFYEDELGRFVKYITEAETTPDLSAAVQKRIEEIKAYTVYLCKYYELFCELKSLQENTAHPEIKNQKIEELLSYTWRLYDSRIFHNSTLNDLLKAKLPADQRSKWDIQRSEHFKGITVNASEMVKTAFELIRKKYLPLATPFISLTDSFLEAQVDISADSIHIVTIDEASFGNLSYPLTFYCSAPGILKVKYNASPNNNKGKIAMISVEQSDYSYMKTFTISNEKTAGSVTFNLPAKGQYKLYLSQYGATHMSFVIYPGKNLFYHNKKSILMNGLVLQDNNVNTGYPNRFLAIYNSAADSLRFSNLYPGTSNTCTFYSASGERLAVIQNKGSFYNSVAIPAGGQNHFIYYENSQFRWPPVLKNAAPYYFFLKSPVK